MQTTLLIAVAASLFSCNFPDFIMLLLVYRTSVVVVVVVESLQVNSGYGASELHEYLSHTLEIQDSNRQADVTTVSETL